MAISSNTKKANIQTQQIHKTTTGITREYSSNSKGYFRAKETVHENGDVEISSDAGSQNFKSGNSTTVTRGNNINNSNNSSSVVNGLSETVTGSNYQIVGSAEAIHMELQAQADKAQAKIVAARSQPDEVPDTSLVAPLADLFKLAPGLSKCIKQPAAEDAKKKMEAVKPPASGALVGGIMYDVQCELIKMGSLIAACSMDTVTQMAEIQANYMKDTAMKNFEEKKKMFQKLKGPSATAFKENMGKSLFPDGEFSLESGLNTVANLTNPATLMAMFIPPSTENTPKKKNFDKEQYQKIAAEEQTKTGGVLDIERKIN